MADYRRSEIVSGLFVFAAIAIFTLFAFRVQGMNLLGFLSSDSFAMRAHFADAKTLEAGAKVTVAGRRVGSVRSIRVISRPVTAADVDQLDAGDLQVGQERFVVEVDFDVSDPNVRFDPKTGGVLLAQDGFLGRNFLALDPGAWDPSAAPAPLLESGLTQPVVVATRATGGIEALLGSTRPILARVERILAKLEEGLLSSDNIERTGNALDDLATSLHAVREAMNDENPDGLRKRVLQPLGEVLDQAAGLLTEARPRVNTILGDIDAATDDLAQRIDRIETDLRALLASSSGMINENRAEIAETMRRLRRTMWQAEMAARKVRANPAVVLFGDDEPDLEQRGVDHGTLDRSGRARPFEQRDETESGRK